MKRNPLLCLALAGCLTLNSCAVIIQGSKQDISISAPADAEVFINGQKVGQGQFQTRVKRKGEKTITALVDGRQIHSEAMPRRTQAGFIIADIGLAITGFGFAWLLVDGITGAWNKHTKTHYTIHSDIKAAN